MQSSNHNTVKAHSCAMQISHRTTLNQFRAWLVMLKNSMPRAGEPSAATHKMRLADLWREMGSGASRANRHDAYLKDLLRGLVDVKVEWNLLGKDKQAEWGIVSLLAGVRLRGGMVEWDYSAFLRERLHAPRMFALLNLGIVNRFSSKYALALYCVAADYKGLSATPFIPIDKFRHLMGLGAGEYADFRALNRRVIKEPLDEINSISDLSVSAEYRKECRRVSAIRFHILPNPNWRGVPTAPKAGYIPRGDSKGGGMQPSVAAQTPHSPNPNAPAIMDAPGTTPTPSPFLSDSRPAVRGRFLTNTATASRTAPLPGAAGTPTDPSSIGQDLPLKEANLLRRLVYRFGFSESAARKLMADYDQAVLRSNVELGEAALQRHSLDNPSGWLLAALKHDWASPQRLTGTERKAKHKGNSFFSNQTGNLCNKIKEW